MKNKMLLKKIFTCLMALVMFVSTLSVMGSGAFAKETDAKGLEKAIILAKKVFDIGDEYTEFSYYIGNSKVTSWNMTWTTEDRSTQISVSVDANENITNYNYYSNDERAKAPKYTMKEMLGKAKEYIAKIAPKVKDSYQLESMGASLWGANYGYTFERVENGITFPYNNIFVRIDYETGNIVGFSLIWDYDISFPSPNALPDKEVIIDKCKDSVEMELIYHITDYGNEPYVYLAYQPSRNDFSIDAKTGEIFETNTYIEANGAKGYSDDAMEEAAVNDSASAMPEPKLSDAEKGKIEEMNNLISGDEAYKKLKSYKSLYFDSHTSTITKNLQNWNDQYVWYIYMEDLRPYEKGVNDFRGFAFARIDAKTGELLSYSARIKNVGEYTSKEKKNLKANYTKTECKEIFTKFAKKMDKGAFADTKLTACEKSHPIKYNSKTEKTTYGGYDLTYSRYYDGIKVGNNQFSGSVDAVTGKIYLYEKNWTPVKEFPDAKKAIGKDKAYNIFMNTDGFEPQYEYIYIYNDNGSSYEVDTKTRIVYRKSVYPNRFDAITGKQIYWSGTVVESEKEHNFDYTDIEDSKYKRSIELMAGLGVGFEGPEFHPEKEVTVDEFVELALMIPTLNTYANTFSGDEALTRELAAKMLTQYLELSKLANLDIYKTGYYDENLISKENLGCVAILKGIGVMGARKNNMFMPNEGLTRAEAMEILLQALVYSTKL